nr:hypothetical protein [Tardiphaga sp. vice304]
MPRAHNVSTPPVRQRDHQRRAKIAEQSEQHDDDQQCAFAEIAGNRLHGRIDQNGAV